MILTKEILRAQMRSLRDHLTREEVALHSAAIVSLIQSATSYQTAQTIALYFPMGAEVDLMALLNDSTKRFVFPRIVDRKQKQMVFAVVSQGFVSGIFGSSEPDGHVVTPSEIDLILVPGLCFSREGDRIGYGAGYYDNYLRTYSGPKIGVGYAFQLLNQIPKETHDVRLDGVFTPLEDLCIPL